MQSNLHIIRIRPKGNPQVAKSDDLEFARKARAKTKKLERAMRRKAKDDSHS